MIKKVDQIFIILITVIIKEIYIRKLKTRDQVKGHCVDSFNLTQKRQLILSLFKDSQCLPTRSMLHILKLLSIQLDFIFNDHSSIINIVQEVEKIQLVS